MDFIRNQLLPRVNSKLSNEYDRIWIVLADEGHGKSTLMMQLVWFWLQETGHDPTVEDVIDKIAWSQSEFKRAMADRKAKDPIVVHDAARVLNKKRAMERDQVTVEEDLLDSRQGRYFTMLGYQDWDVVATPLATRRAHNVLRIPRRGKVELFSRSQIDKRNEDGKWPKPAAVDTFDSLEGTELWDRFKSEDLQRKRDRIAPEETEAQEMGEKELAELLLNDEDIEDYVSIHGGNGSRYVDSDLIAVEKGISGRKARRVKKLIEREVTV